MFILYFFVLDVILSILYIIINLVFKIIVWIGYFYFFVFNRCGKLRFGEFKKFVQDYIVGILYLKINV